MERAERALAVSVMSRGWSALLQILVIPIYVQYLGVESYGVVGLFVSFSAMVAFLDFGLGATLTRELARMSSSASQLPDSRNLTRTFELIYALVAVFLGLVVLAFSSPLAEHWVNVESADPIEIADALALGGIALLFQWPSSLYSAGLAGQHRQTLLGIVVAMGASVRVGVTLVALSLESSLSSFFLAQIISAFFQTLLLRTTLWAGMPLPGHSPVFDSGALRRSIAFAGDMTAISIASIVLTQIDKLILSNALTLRDFGVYVITSTLAAGLYMVISPFFSVMYPRLTHLVSLKNERGLFEFYHAGSQALTFLLIPLAAVLVCFSKDILYVWSGDPLLSSEGAVVLSLLVLGNSFNGLMNMPYALQLAHGWTRLALWINIGGLLFIVPASWFAATTLGPAGASGAWLALNAGFFLIWPSLLHARIGASEKYRWYWNDVSRPFVSAIAAAYILNLVRSKLIDPTRFELAFVILFAWCLVVLVTGLLLPTVRARTVRLFTKMRQFEGST